MTVKERDPLTGHLTTGHEWNGITELNTRVPRAVWFFVIVTHVWALVVWVLLPTWPLVTTYTKGLLHRDQRTDVQMAVVAGNADRAGWADRIDALPAEEILADPELMARVEGTAHQLFGDNCAACHGRNAAGGPGFPSLIDTAWLWGGTPDDIMETLRVGINSNHPDTRIAQMPAFGHDGLLPQEDLHKVEGYVRSLSNLQPVADAASISAGATIFAENCAACHGDAGKGNIELGAPNLTDAFWIYGGSEEAIYQTLWAGRHGWMPTWEARLTETERKMLMLHILNMGKETTQ